MNRLRLRRQIAIAIDRVAGKPCFKNPQTDRNDQAGIFGERNEIRWIDEAALGMLPANQRFKAGELAVLERNDRLVVNAELFAIERAAQVVFHFSR